MSEVIETSSPAHKPDPRAWVGQCLIGWQLAQKRPLKEGKAYDPSKREFFVEYGDYRLDADTSTWVAAKPETRCFDSRADATAALMTAPTP